MKVKLETDKLLISFIPLTDKEKIDALSSLLKTDRSNTLGIQENTGET